MKRLFYLRPPFFKTKDMDYKEKYEQGLECIQEILSGAGDTIRTSILQKRLQPFFPELKESEDERIRKAIHIYLDWLDGRKDYAPKGIYSIKDMIAWVEKQGNKSVNIDVESMVSSYEQRLESQGGTKYTPLVNMCLTSFRHGVENVLEELNLKKLEKQGEKKPTENVQELDADKVKEHVPIMLEYMQNYVENIRKVIKGE